MSIETSWMGPFTLCTSQTGVRFYPGSGTFARGSPPPPRTPNLRFRFKRFGPGPAKFCYSVVGQWTMGIMHIFNTYFSLQPLCSREIMPSSIEFSSNYSIDRHFTGWNINHGAHLWAQSRELQSLHNTITHQDLCCLPTPL